MFAQAEKAKGRPFQVAPSMMVRQCPHPETTTNARCDLLSLAPSARRGLGGERPALGVNQGAARVISLPLSIR